MQLQELDTLISKYMELVPLENSISRPEAERRAAAFLIIQAHLTTYLLQLREQQIAATSKLNAVYAAQLAAAGGKTITENKIAAEASAPYQEAREELEKINSHIEYLRTYHKIFIDAHILHRNIGKEPIGE